MRVSRRCGLDRRRTSEFRRYLTGAVRSGGAMNICFLPSTVTPDRGALHLLTTYLVNDRIAIDAGSLGIFATPQDQARIKHVFISHYHADHVATLPIFLDNVAGQGDSVTVYASEAVLDCPRRDLFSDRMWPDFFAFERDGVPFVRAEIVFAARYEMARNVDDVLSRRTRARLLARDASAAAAQEVAELIGDELGLSASQRAEQVAWYQQSVEEERQAPDLPVSGPTSCIDNG